MRLEYTRIQNYKCFADTGSVPLGERFTVLVGQNNSGKTAFLEALRAGSLVDKPHREPAKAADGLEPPLDPKSLVTFGVSLAGAELRHAVLLAGAAIHIPVPGRGDDSIGRRAIEGLFARPRIDLELSFSSGWRPSPNSTATFPEFPGAELDRSALIRANDDKQDWTFGGWHANRIDELPGFAGTLLQQRLYVFKAERLIPSSGIEGHGILRPDASNLPAVLLHLNDNPEAQNTLRKLLREVFPAISDARGIDTGPSSASINVFMATSGDGAAGIKVPLAESGTGVGQVLAMLYIAITAERPQIIVIDEPNSFLHPGAAKKLIAILKDFPHQYIITTHSPEIIRAAEPDRLHRLAWNGRESVVETISANDLAQLQSVLDDLGVRFSDLFGADQIVWVEGPTEERCFPLLLKAGGRTLPPGVAFVKVVNTGDLTGGTRKDLIFRIYRGVSQGGVMIPPALAFSFDRDTLSERDIEDLNRKSNGAAHFFQRRTYENYLLDSDAIAAVFNESIVDPAAHKTAEAVTAWLRDHGAAKRYAHGTRGAPVATEGWLAKVHASKLLADLFSDLSEKRLEYHKTDHSFRLTKWLIQNKPAYLSELTAYVDGLIGRADRASP